MQIQKRYQLSQSKRGNIVEIQWQTKRKRGTVSDEENCERCPWSNRTAVVERRMSRREHGCNVNSTSNTSKRSTMTMHPAARFTSPRHTHDILCRPPCQMPLPWRLRCSERLTLPLQHSNHHWPTVTLVRFWAPYFFT